MADLEQLIGLFAYDTGCVDSGIHDEVLRAQLIAQLKSLDPESFRLQMSRFVREHFLSEQALENGYGIEDVKDFIEWFNSHSGYFI